MMDAIHAEGKERGAVQDFDGVALIHAEVQIKEHRSLQVAVARYCEKLGDRGDKGMPLAGVECVINPRGRFTC